MYYIVGTDTGVGKTSVAKKLAQAGNKVIKPIETGKEEYSKVEQSDSQMLADIQNVSLDVVNKYFFTKACSPHLAARLDNEQINISDLKQFILSSGTNTYIELAGGLLVPLIDQYTQLDLIKETNGEVILVIANKIGAINHSLLTIDKLKQNGIIIKQIIFNNFSNEQFYTNDAIETIVKLGGLQNVMISIFTNENDEWTNYDHQSKRD